MARFETLQSIWVFSVINRSHFYLTLWAWIFLENQPIFWAEGLKWRNCEETHTYRRTNFYFSVLNTLILRIRETFLIMNKRLKNTKVLLGKKSLIIWDHVEIYPSSKQPKPNIWNLWSSCWVIHTMIFKSNTYYDIKRIWDVNLNYMKVICSFHKKIFGVLISCHLHPFQVNYRLND